MSCSTVQVHIEQLVNPLMFVVLQSNKYFNLLFFFRQQEHLALQVLEPSHLYPVEELVVEATAAVAAPAVIVEQV